MADDKTKTDARDRSRVAGGQDYEVQHFAKYYRSASRRHAISSPIKVSCSIVGTSNSKFALSLAKLLSATVRFA